MRADAGAALWTSTALRAPWLDGLMGFVSGLPASLLICGGWLATARARQRGLLALTLLALLAISDAAARLGQTLIERPRPCVSLPPALAVAPCPDRPSFPSAHATSVAAWAALATVCDRRRWPLWVGVGLLVGISRIYLGVHYPLDVLGGGALGLALGTIAGLLTRGRLGPAPAVV